MDAIDRMDFGLYMDIAADRARRKQRGAQGRGANAQRAGGGGNVFALKRGTIDQIKGW